MAREVLLHAEEQPLPGLRRLRALGRERRVARRFRRRREVALLLVFFEHHQSHVHHEALARLDEERTSRRRQSRARAVTYPNSVFSGIELKNPAAQPASLLPKAFERNHTPIISPTMRSGASLVTALRPTGLMHSSPSSEMK